MVESMTSHGDRKLDLFLDSVYLSDHTSLNRWMGVLLKDGLRGGDREEFGLTGFA
jgi:hypothetical protein